MNSILEKDQLLLGAIITIGIIMRLLWVGDMEWKDDEKIMYNLSHRIVEEGSFPVVGMMSGGGVVNPGLSVGVFALIAAFTDNPLSMARAVQLVNILAILLFLLFIRIKVPHIEKKTWLWGLALATISPLAVLFSRKIWAQDLLPFFCLLLIFGNAYRQQKWGAFLWGFAGALIGQVHMSGFFLAAGISLYTFLYDRYQHNRIHWRFFIAGSLAGGIWLLPWFIYIIQNEQHSYLMLRNVMDLSFFRFWMLDAHGLNIIYSLGDNFWDFVKEPFIGENPTYVVGALHGILVFTGFLTLLWIFNFTWKMIILLRSKKILPYLFNKEGLARFYLQGIFIGLGLMMTFSGTAIYEHYLICAFPFSYIFLVKVHFKRQVLLRCIIMAQLIITMSFLYYVHCHGGAMRGDYKRTYQLQMQYDISN